MFLFFIKFSSLKMPIKLLIESLAALPFSSSIIIYREDIMIGLLEIILQTNLQSSWVLSSYS